MRVWVLGVVLALVAAPEARAISFGFESLTITRSGAQPASGTQKAFSVTSEGLTMEIAVVRETSVTADRLMGGFGFDVRQFSPAPAGWQTRSLDPTFNNPSDPQDDDTWF